MAGVQAGQPAVGAGAGTGFITETLAVADDVADYAMGNMVLHHVATPAAIREQARVRVRGRPVPDGRGRSSA
jgi:hypothetical protein